MIAKRLAKHARLCRRNLLSPRVKCCAQCPFEDEIVAALPGLGPLFRAKRRALRGGKGAAPKPL